MTQRSKWAGRAPLPSIAMLVVLGALTGCAVEQRCDGDANCPPPKRCEIGICVVGGEALPDPDPPSPIADAGPNDAESRDAGLSDAGSGDGGETHDGGPAAESDGGPPIDVGPLRLLSGGITSGGGGSAPVDSIRLLEGSLELGAWVCSADSVCMQGGVTP